MTTECIVVSSIMGACVGAIIALLWAKLMIEALKALVIHWQGKAVYWEDQASSKLRDQSELAQDMSLEDGPLT